MIIKLLKYKANFELKKLDPNYKTMPYDKKNAFEHAYVSGFIANVAGEDCALIMGYQKEIHTQEYEITHNSVGRVDFSLPKINGGLKSTLQNYKTVYMVQKAQF